MNSRSARTLLLALGLGAAAAIPTQCRRGGPTPDQATTSAAPAPAAAPGVRILLSGALQGHLEPCGCASGQSGGLPRRMQHVAERSAGNEGGYDLLLEGGDLSGGDSELDLLEASTALLVLFQMRHPYDALGVGPTDLALPPDRWLPLLGMVPAVIASDIECARDDWPGQPFLAKTVGDRQVRVASFALPGPPGGDAIYRVLPPEQAWRRALHGADDATLRVLLVHGADRTARALARSLAPRPDLVVCFDLAYSEPPGMPELVDGVPLVFPGTRGRVLVELSLRRAADGRQLGYELVPLPASKTALGGGGDPDVKLLLREHYTALAHDGVLQRMANRTPTPNGADYVGNAACAACHEASARSWQDTPHARAWQTLVAAERDATRYGWPVTRHPDCVGCHSVGYGQQGGFVDAATTPQFADVGCERCHGPGSRHCQEPAQHRLGLIGGAAASALCVQCHDLEQSPDFVYGDRWPKIHHELEPHLRDGRAGGR